MEEQEAAMDQNIDDLLLQMGRSDRLYADVRQKLLNSEKTILGHLLHALQRHRSSTVRRNAALILGELGNRRAVEPLIKALGDRVISVSSNAAIALGMIGDRRAVPSLIRRLDAPAWQIRLNAAISLGWIADRNAAASLLRLLQDYHPHVRRGAAFALGQLGDRRIYASLTRLLTDKRHPVYEAAMAMAYMGDLSGYFFLDQSLPGMIDVPTPKKSRSKVIQAMKLGNLLYSSSLFPAAAAEYRRALSLREKVSSNVCLAILTNLGNSFCAIGRPDEAIAFYLLALRNKPKDVKFQKNLLRAEVLADIQDLVIESLLHGMSRPESLRMEPPVDIVRLFQSECGELQGSKTSLLFPQFISGWKTFYALEAFRGQNITAPNTPLPVDFLMRQASVCYSIIRSEPSFRPFYLLLKQIGESFTVENGCGPSKEPADADFEKAFLYGYIGGLLQKIWRISHVRFSLN